MPTTFTKGKKRAPQGAAKRSYRSKRNRKVSNRTSAQAQSKQIVALNKRIDTIIDKEPPLRVGLAHQHYNNALVNDVISIVPAYSAGTLTGQGNWIAWGPNVSSIASAPSDISSRNRARVGRIYNRLQFTAGTEHSPCNYNVYHVKLNPITMDQTASELGRNLAGLKTLTSTHNKYFARGTYDAHNLASMGGEVVLNPDLFIVKRSWKFVLANTVGQGDGVNYNVKTVGSVYKNIDYSFPAGYIMGDTKEIPWKGATPDDVQLQHMNYFLIFTDNGSAVEGSPSVRSLSTCMMNCIAD